MSNEAGARPARGVRDEAVLLVLSAPSGTGKTTLARRLVAETPNTVFSVSCTTRQPRGREQDGVDYTFLSEVKFREMVQAELFAEWAEVHGHFYGTPTAVVDDARAHGRVALFDIDVQGGEQLKQRYPSAVTVLILPPSVAEMERRLRARGTDSAATIERRLLAARSEVRRGKSYDYCIVNEDLETALSDLKAIVRAERCRSARLEFGSLGF
jgi:guanylate kinase